MTPTLRGREDAIDHVAATLPIDASRLTRLLIRGARGELSRAEIGVLQTLADGPRRVTELAETEVLAQPTVTQLVDKLQRRGFVDRTRDAGDGRVVLVSATAEGTAQLEATRKAYRALLRATLEGLDKHELRDVVAATATLGLLVERLQQRPARS